MKKLVFIVFLSLTLNQVRGVIGWNGGAAADSVTFFQAGALGAPRYGDGVSSALMAQTDANGNIVSAPVALSDYLSPIVYTLDTNGFSSINGTIYNKAVIGGGAVVILQTNLTWIPTSYFQTNTRVIICSVPSLKTAQLQSPFANSGTMAPPSNPVLQMSSDAGATWQNVAPTTTPVLLSLYDPNPMQTAGAAGLTVTSWINVAAVGSTNDFAGTTVLLDQSANGRSAVNVAGANTIGAQQAALWSQYPATAPVTLNGNPLNMGVWQFSTVSNALVVSASGQTIFTLTSGSASGTLPLIQTLTLSGSNAVFKLTSPNVPTIQVETNLSPSTWSTLANQSNWQSGGFWYVAGAVNPSTNCFFRAYCAGTNAIPNKAIFSAQVTGNVIFTNANGSKFALVVNAATNGFTFVPQ
jgi:hypothetical protein